MLPWSGGLVTRGEDYGFDANFGQGKIVTVCGGFADFFEDIQSFEDGAEDSVLSIELGHGSEADIELTTIRIFGGVDFVREAGHGDGAFGVLEPDFSRERPAWTTSSGFIDLTAAAGGIASLDQGAGEGAVESEPIVEFFLDEFFEVLDCIGSRVVVEADDDLSWQLFLGELDLDDSDFGAEIGGAGGDGGEKRKKKGGGECFHKMGNSRRSASPSTRPVSSATSKRGRLSNCRFR